MNENVTIVCAFVFIASAALCLIEHFTLPPFGIRTLSRYVAGIVAIAIPATIARHWVTTADGVMWLWWAAIIGAGCGTVAAYFISWLQDRWNAREVRRDE